MVFESLSNPFKAEKKPFNLFFIGLIYGTLALFLSVWIFKQYSGIVMVFFVTLASVPLFYNTMRFEEKKDLEIHSEKQILKEHFRALLFFMFLFIGTTAAFSFWYVVLPVEETSMVFKIQTETISAINQQATGSFFERTIVLSKIFLNNIKVMIFSFLFSFIYGSGGIFILSWNSSVIATAIGNFIRTHVAKYVGMAGFSKFTAYFYAVPLSLLRYSLHGLPEILSYFIAGLAGGLISIAIVNKHYKTEMFDKILLDVSDLLLISITLLFLSAFIEVYVTPLFF